METASKTRHEIADAVFSSLANLLTATARAMGGQTTVCSHSRAVWGFGPEPRGMMATTVRIEVLPDPSGCINPRVLFSVTAPSTGSNDTPDAVLAHGNAVATAALFAKIAREIADCEVGRIVCEAVPTSEFAKARAINT